MKYVCCFQVQFHLFISQYVTLQRHQLVQCNELLPGLVGCWDSGLLDLAHITRLDSCRNSSVEAVPPRLVVLLKYPKNSASTDNF
jgi:hypothetical protein